MPPRLHCRQLRSLVDDIQKRMVVAPSTKADPSLDRSFAEGVLDWADPHGLWTAAPDAPLAPVVRNEAAKLRAVVEGRAPCPGKFRELGAAMTRWIDELRLEYDAALATPLATPQPDDRLVTELFDGVLEDGPPTRPGRALARRLGAHVLLASQTLPDLRGLRTQAQERWLPVLDERAWSEVLMAAAVRSWVPLIDPHGAWAPLEESVTLYDRDLEYSPPTRLWSTSTRVAIGVRIDSGAALPLRDGDIVVEVDGIATAGLSAEAVDQLAESDSTHGASPRRVTVVRRDDSPGRERPLFKLDVEVDHGREEPEVAQPSHELVPYGSKSVLVVHLDDVPDALGEELASTLAMVHGPKLAGVLLDLRGNGGGSIEGATSTLGLFLPGAPLFPLRSRDGGIETERATEPPVEERWTGPVATLVDGGTASAAEMIAGALHAYRRGPALGALTYGKGCAQEYLDDATGTGVLRLTTLLFALPDGTAVQRVGIQPDLPLPLPALPGIDREADHARAAPTWTGPDVRDPARVGEVAWPRASTVGPCSDEHVCRALRALGAGRRDVARR